VVGTAFRIRESAMCLHDGFYTCVGRYDRRAACLVYVMVCDACEQVVEQVSEQSYEPHYVPLGNATR
jgi:hypothetical protein